MLTTTQCNDYYWIMFFTETYRALINHECNHGILDPLEMERAKNSNFAGQKKEFLLLVSLFMEWWKKRKNRGDGKITF